MPNQFNNTTFSTTYKDDFRDSDHYHRILFNSGRALQARELTQSQTITQKEVERFGKHIFKEGSVVLPGNLTLDTNYEYVKLETADTTGFAVGDEITGGTSSVKAKILRIEPQDGVDPATFYIKYTDTSAATTNVTAIRFTNGETLSNGTTSIQAQVISTTANPHAGVGSKASVAGGTYFTRGHFVLVDQQTIIVDKYSNEPNDVIGMQIVEDIVTVSDTDALYDNQNNNIPNLTAPGADRYRIRLFLTLESLLDSGDSFFPINKIVNGVLQEEVDQTEYSIIGDEIAQRTKEESGDYVVEGYKSVLLNGDSDSVLNCKIEPGIAYVDGYRVSIRSNTNLLVNKPRETEVVEETISANYGNYIIVNGASSSTIQGIPNIDTFQEWNLRSATGYGGSTIGTARIRAVSKDGSNYRYYIFDVQMTAGQKFSSVRSIGSSTVNFADLVLESGVAVIKEATNNNLFFLTNKIRPALIDDITLTVQRRFSGTTDGSGQLDLSGQLGIDESFSNQTSWIVAVDSAGDASILTGASASGGVVTTGRSQVDDIEVLALVDKTGSAVTVRSKTSTTTTETGVTLDSADGVIYAELANPDIISVGSVLDGTTGADVEPRFRLDNGQRDNFYYNGRLILVPGQTAPASVDVTYTYYAHGAGDLFAVNSYAATDYASIPKYTQRDGVKVDLRNALDFRPYKANDAASYTTANINELPQNTDTIVADTTYYKGRRDSLVITSDGDLEYIEGIQSLDNAITPSTPGNAMKLKEFTLFPYTDDREDTRETFIQNRRYTMRDITAIENRISNIEEVTTLNMLEMATASLEVLDSAGNNRFKNGFFADNFKDFVFSAAEDVEYNASIDLINQILVPDVVTNGSVLVYDSDNALSTNVTLSGNLLTLDYSETNLIDQNICSGTENVNPFEVYTFVGNLELEPARDVWNETVNVTRVVSRVRTVGARGTAVNGNNFSGGNDGGTAGPGFSLSRNENGGFNANGGTWLG